MKKYFNLIVFIIILISILLRFANYNNRFGLALDQAHDLMVARFALQSHQIPLLGPFSSAGPFQTGGEWYWIVMAGSLINFSWILSPWIFITILFIGFIALIIRFGQEILDDNFGLILGIFAAVSTAQISQSTNLTNQSPIAIFSLLALWSMLRFVKNKKEASLFFLGFFSSLAASIHLQGVLVLILIPITLFYTKYFKPKGLLVLLIGLILPLSPILLSDITHNFFNFRNISFYYLHDQYRVSLDVLGRRWITFLGNFLPNSWGLVIGGNIFTGYLMMFGSIFLIFYQSLRKKLLVEWKIILTATIVDFFILRYTRTPLFDSYLMFIHPFILVMSAFLVYWTIKKNLFLGIFIATIILGFSLYRDFLEITYSKANYTAVFSEKTRDILIKKYPNDKFALYDYKRSIPRISFPFSLYLDVAEKIDDNGRKIGIASSAANLKIETIYKSDEILLLNLNDKSKSDLAKEEWSFINPSAIYKETENWH